MWRRISLVLLGLTSTACAAATSTSRPVEFAGRNVITAAEIVASSVHDLYFAVHKLRPEFLRRRGSGPESPFTESRVMVYVDGVRYGPVQSLHLIPPEIVKTIRYIRAAEANMLFGGAHSAGAIQVTTHR